MINKTNLDYKGRKEKILSLIKAEGKKQPRQVEKLPRLMSISNHCEKHKSQGVVSLFAVPIANTTKLQKVHNGRSHKKQYKEELLDRKPETYYNGNKNAFEKILKSTGAKEKLKKDTSIRLRTLIGKTLSRQENLVVPHRPLRGKSKRTLNCVMSRETLTKEDEKLEDEDYQHFDLRVLDLYMEDGDVNSLCVGRVSRATTKQRKILPRKTTKQVKEDFIDANVQQNRAKDLQPIVSTRCRIRRRYVDELSVDLTFPLLTEYCRIGNKESEV